jgi:o-succinylbenzoate synthase
VKDIKFIKYKLNFFQPARTSRDTLYERKVYYLILEDKEKGIRGIGECAPLSGLGVEDFDSTEKKIKEIEKSPSIEADLAYSFPALNFAFETALTDLENQGKRILYASDWTKGNSAIPINGLVWISSVEEMKRQIKQKVREGYSCIKIKTGAHDFRSELSLIRWIRHEYPKELEIRLDANAAYRPHEVREKLKYFSDYHIHSIEQPIAKGLLDEMAALCEEKIIPVALDEELIGIYSPEEKKMLLENIQPQYIILKPTLLGGFKACEEWMDIAAKNKCGWWITSALESNIALNAIAQWTYQLGVSIPQGLGTGQLFTNNIRAPLFIKNGALSYDPDTSWDIKIFS